MKVEKLDHVHIAVKDLDSAVNFFSWLFNTRFSPIMEIPEWNVRSSLCPLGVEIVQATSPNGDIAKFIERRGEGLHVISMKVPNLEAAIEEVQSRGLRVQGILKSGNAKEAWIHPKDCFGVMVEILEYEEIHPAAVASLWRDKS